MKKGFLKDIEELDPDVLCLQETKGAEDEVATTLEQLKGYHVYVNSSKARKGYSGTALLSKVDPINVTYDIGIEEFDQEGRVITAEFLQHFVVTVYTPNAGDGLARLDFREQWDEAFKNYVNWLARRKPVIVCGDLNVAHHEIDIARPKENYNKSAGYTQREIDGFQRLLDSGFTDTFRALHPKEVKYSYWNYVTFAREKNLGWRIDYFLVSNKLFDKVKAAEVYDQYMGSDHCPVGVKLEK